jgi:hypothetical protein
MTRDRPTELLAAAREIAERIPDFQAVRGPGTGDHSTAAFMKTLQARAVQLFGADFSECKICGETAFAVDFYFPEEATIVEVALGLPNSQSEFEKDVLKAIIARESGREVRRLFFISRAGAQKKCFQPGRAAVIKWVLENHEVRIEVHDLGGEPRRRNQRPRKADDLRTTAP